MTAHTSGARYLAEALAHVGVTHVFFMDAILRRTLVELEQVGVRRVLAHSEKAAAYMADGYARVSGRVGVCMAQSVGAMNLAAGLQDAYLACSPVIAITGRLPGIHLQRHGYQEVEHVAPFSAVTKYHATITEIEQFPVFLRQAFREAVSGTPGPVHLDVTGYTGTELAKITAELQVIVEEQYTRIPPYRPEAEVTAVREAVRLLAEAQRPVIVAGGGVRWSGAAKEVALHLSKQ